MEVALGIVTTLFFLVLLGASIAVCIVALRKQDETNKAIDDGFVGLGLALKEAVESCNDTTIKAANLLNHEAEQREAAQIERIDVWMPPNEGCEICGSEAAVCCSGPDMRAVWLCGACYHDDGSFE